MKNKPQIITCVRFCEIQERFQKTMKMITNKTGCSSHLAGRLVGWLAPDTKNAIKLTYVMIGQQKFKTPIQNKAQHTKTSPNNSFKITYVMIWNQKHIKYSKTITKHIPKWKKKQASNHYVCIFCEIRERFLKTMKKNSSHLAGRLVGWLIPDTQNVK